MTGRTAGLIGSKFDEQMCSLPVQFALHADKHSYVKFTCPPVTRPSFANPALFFVLADDLALPASGVCPARGEHVSRVARGHT